uniref:Uncharacterized protein n=1 Tax=Panagrellus redivivus TaxID=6233 RepID=A0A7E4UQ19_PANRE
MSTVVVGVQTDTARNGCCSRVGPDQSISQARTTTRWTQGWTTTTTASGGQMYAVGESNHDTPGATAGDDQSGGRESIAPMIMVEGAAWESMDVTTSTGVQGGNGRCRRALLESRFAPKFLKMSEEREGVKGLKVGSSEAHPSTWSPPLPNNGSPLLFC